MNFPHYCRRYPYLVLGLACSTGLMLWEFAAGAGIIKKATWSCPSEIVIALVHDLQEPASAVGDQNARKTLVPHIGLTLGRFVVGFLAAAMVGVTAGFLLSVSKPLNAVVAPVVNVLRSLPSAAVWPVCAAILGYGLNSQMFVVIFGTTWPILVYTMKGVGALRHEVHDSLQFMWLEWYRRWWVLFLWSLPSIMTGLEVGCAIAFLLSVTVEVFYPASGGLGWYLGYYVQAGVESDRLFAGLSLIAFLGWAANTGMHRLRRLLIYWEGNLREIVRQKSPNRMASVIRHVSNEKRQEILATNFVTDQIERLYGIKVRPNILYQGEPYMFPKELRSALKCVPFSPGIVQRDITISAPVGPGAPDEIILFARSWILERALSPRTMALLHEQQQTIGTIVRTQEHEISYRHLWYRERISDKLGRVFGHGGTVHVIQRSRVIAVAGAPAILVEEFVPV